MITTVIDSFGQFKLSNIVNIDVLVQIGNTVCDTFSNYLIKSEIFQMLLCLKLEFFSLKTKLEFYKKIAHTQL